MTSEIGLILFLLLRLFVLALIVRIIVEMIQSFSRQFNPPRWFVLIVEPLFLVTDPPVKLLRKLIPPLRLGGVALDISVIVLFLIVQLVARIIEETMIF